MSDGELLANVTLILDPGSDYENEEVDELTRRFQADLNDQNEVITADRSIGMVESGAKAVAVQALNAVDISARPGLFAGLIGMVRNWVNGGEDRRVELTFPQAEYEQLRPPIRYAPGAAGEGGWKGMPSRSSRSGGADITADEVTVGDDVVGRDKIMSAGGHIIIAREGATIIFNDPSAVATPAPAE
jgi:hypothetical protein